jgi:zinc D-Ala-D-Ala carboxypeptidase
MQLSKNLSLAEMVLSESAKIKHINNQPTVAQIENMKLLATNIFQPVRDHFKVPIHVSSGFRCVALNKAIGGSATSQHCDGEAMDIDMEHTSVKNSEIFQFIKDNLNFDQLIWEFGTTASPDWVHVSFASDRGQRKEVLRSVLKGSKTVYEGYK